MMKKFLLLVAAIVACAMGMAAQQTLTIYEDAVSTNNYVPIYGYFCDAYLKCEFVVPSTELTAMTGKDIKQLKWYLNEAPSSYSGNGWGDANFQIFMKEVEATTLETFTGLDDATMVYDGSLDPTGLTELDIELANPYSYNGGNLLIGVYNTAKGSFMSAYFVGEIVENACVQGYNAGSLESISATMRSFIPKTTFTYGEKAAYAASVMPEALDFGKVYPGESNVLNIKVKNNGTNAFTPAVTVAAPFGTTYEAAELAAGAEVEIPITYAPTALGDDNSQLTVDCGEAGTYTVSLAGVCSNELEAVVCDGASTSAYAPVYGYNYDCVDARVQMIYPAEKLADLEGVNITGIIFHPMASLSFSGGELQLSLGSTDATAFTMNDEGIENPVTGLTDVASVVAVNGAKTLEFTFDTPYKYEGGNLAVQTLVTEAGTYGSTTFMGELATDASFYEYDGNWGSGFNTVNFLPKMTILYTKAEEEPETPAYYVVGGFNGWSQQEGLVEITEEGATIEVAAQDFENPDDTAQEFKLITPAEDGGWIWYGGEDANGVGYFGITEELLGANITLDDAGANFRLPEAGTYTIKLVADRAAVNGLKMVVTKEAQTAETVTVTGVVTDASQQPLEGVTVTISSNDRAEFTGTTDAAGAYSIEVTPVAGATYTMTFVKDGYKTVTLEDVDLEGVNDAVMEPDNLTGITTIAAEGGNVKYVNVMGQVSDRPFPGVNIIVRDGKAIGKAIY